MAKKEENNLLNKLVSFTKRRGFVFQSSEIYGGFSSCYDFGPLGVELKNNIKKEWWKKMTRMHDNIVGIDASVLMSPKVWEASGHLTAGFADELVECKKCHHRFRKDLLEKNKCPDCGGELTNPKKFNLMLKTFVGPVEDDSAITYLRPETCQGIYVNFKNVLQSMRAKLPFGIAQIGKSFRNEITPKDFIFRTREFEQMEMQWFCDPKDADKFFEYWLEERMNWYIKLGIKKENLRAKETEKNELAHYAKRAVDIEYKFPFGWKEIEGVHNRGEWDLLNHSKHSGQDLSYTNDEGKKFTPYIIETSAGADRALFTLLCEGFKEIEGGRTETTDSTKEVETVLDINKKLAPVKIAVLPLVKNKEEITKTAKEIFDMLKVHFDCQYDESGSIGRRYRRQDEIGTPYCITVDFETLDNKDVTLRDRDTMKQERVKISELGGKIFNLLTS
ncbi:MAG: glycine--tRNA ligase [Candidatus Staskawiczbacteria bacterium RIFOXYC1_FULL_37_43]|nr:MAG: glycine--tRNA ligase [Candidatus Staskawiczbacteria bacterium RIFCSPHIGHO2_01_FULL_37_17]OGZ71301.1 MAG: glycine--tRNA ligase [Candidatus Staskawiczbacteria bacterium RIFCSPLOWO2_01_FULL_37_19]OGZ76383.1 MAG: glycine--tRNA ligase [Candidatus Staskawiczbacteria bacterium RIFOXYA1_FULL_37_15]OGZ77388.1 MAG: glycine--tRNA ligase [Candidatus Staskawiczbacteria bacterium RIFOXYA12_FULL_37_10]OGZ80399.1 MAG: glycine--tRNA ligase [Candidatus Staskawiczbacteria bacterium RIFOXYB1_FULL_38_37]OG